MWDTWEEEGKKRDGRGKNGIGEKEG